MDLNNKLFMRFVSEQAGGKAPWGSKLTEEQKAYARALWHQFVEIRQILGTCIQCNRKHRSGEQRCTLHRNKNRAKCLAWAHEHRDEIRAEYKRRVSLGVCVNNPAHGAAFGNHICCKTCHLRRKQQKKARNP